MEKSPLLFTIPIISHIFKFVNYVNIIFFRNFKKLFTNGKFYYIISGKHWINNFSKINLIRAKVIFIEKLSKLKINFC